jgi:hypothetical protein
MWEKKFLRMNLIHSSLFSPLLLCRVGTLCHLQRSLQFIHYIILEFIPSTAFLYLPLPWFLEWFQQVSFLHLQTCAHIFCTVLPFYPFLSHPPTGANPPDTLGRTFSTLLFSNFVEEKRETIKRKTSFLLVWDKASYTGSFLGIFPCIYVLYPQLVYFL